MESQNNSTKTHLNNKHIQEIRKRGLPLDWALANCRSLSAIEVSSRLGYTAKSDGILLEGVGIQIQFKPDKPWRDDKNKKAPKYRSPLGDYDAILLHHPEDPRYWNDLEALKQKAFQINGHPCLAITEGVFTGIAMNAAGIATIVLLGVEMGLTSAKNDPQKKRYLVPTLEKLAKAGFGFIFCFDADAATKSGVRWAQRKLAHQLKPFQVPLYNVTGLWQCDNRFSNGNKGADDYIQNYGATKFTEIIAKCVPINQWEKQFDETPSVDWNEPQSCHSTIGYWKSDQDGDVIWEPRCNFDFTIERELVSREGGGFVLQLKPEWEQKQYRVLIKASDLTSPEKFTSALCKALGFVIVVSLSKWELNALIAAKQAAYRRHREGQIFRSIDRYGQQENGLWVFANAQFTPDGEPTTENDTLVVFDPALGKEDFIPCPILGQPNGTFGLKNLVEAAKEVFGADNINQFLLCCGWVVAGLHFQQIKEQEGRFPVLNAYGSIGSGKTIALEAALSLVGTNWAAQGTISKVTISAVYEHLSKTGSLPVIWDDPPRGDNPRELDEFCKAMYNAKPRVVRGNRQTPYSPIGFTSNHVLGGEHDAAFTRFTRVPFYPGGNTQAIANLKEAMKLASGSFCTLIAMGYHPEEINAIERQFLARLPLAHARIAWNLALVVHYAEKIIESIGGLENPRQWVLQNLLPIENDADNTGDSVADFIRCIQALEGKDEIGSWDKRPFTDEHGVQWMAICATSVWSEVQKAFKPATYNQKSLKAQLLKMGSVVDKAVRFHESRDAVLAYNRAVLTAGCNQDGNPIRPNPPKKKIKKAWLIPLHLFPDIDSQEKASDGECQPVLDSETVETDRDLVTVNRVSSLDAFNTNASSSSLPDVTPETAAIDIQSGSNLHMADNVTAADDEFFQNSISNSENCVSPVSSTETRVDSGLQPVSPLVSNRVRPVSPVSLYSPESALGTDEDKMPHAVTLRRADGRSIDLPANYPGTRALNQTKEPRQIAKLLAAIQSQTDWRALASRYGESLVLWVWRWHFNQTERIALLEIINGDRTQQNLFD